MPENQVSNREISAAIQALIAPFARLATLASGKPKPRRQAHTANSSKGETTRQRSALRMHRRTCMRTKSAHQRHDECQRGRYVFGVDVSSFALGIACLQPWKKCDQTHLRFSQFPTAKTCRRFIFFTAHGKRRYWSCDSSACRVAVLLCYCIDAFSLPGIKDTGHAFRAPAARGCRQR